MSLGQSLRKLRKIKGITLATLATKVGSHVGNLSRIERDMAKPSLELLYKIAQAMDYQMIDIFQEADGCYATSRQSALNTLFISLVEQDQELLLEFAELLQKRQQKNLAEIEVALHKQPADASDEQKNNE